MGAQRLLPEFVPAVAGCEKSQEQHDLSASDRPSHAISLPKITGRSQTLINDVEHRYVEHR